MTDRTRLPLPEPAKPPCPRCNGPTDKWEGTYSADQLRDYSDACNAALRAELAKHQESEFHPDWSMLSATRDSLAEHQDMIRRLSEQVRVLREVVESAAAADVFQNSPGAMDRLAVMARKALGGTK